MLINCLIMPVMTVFLTESQQIESSCHRNLNLAKCKTRKENNEKHKLKQQAQSFDKDSSSLLWNIQKNNNDQLHGLFYYQTADKSNLSHMSSRRLHIQGIKKTEYTVYMQPNICKARDYHRVHARCVSWYLCKCLPNNYSSKLPVHSWEPLGAWTPFAWLNMTPGSYRSL